MPLEYEIKYVLHDNGLEEELRKLALQSKLYSVIHIEQHYLSRPARIRKSTQIIKGGLACSKSVKSKYMFAYKPKINGSVIEIETRIDEDDFRLLLPETKKSLIKIRFQEEKSCNNEHWIVDFFKFRGETYFVQAECELYGKIKTPRRTPDFIKNNLAMTALVGDSNFSSRNLCDVTKATELYDQIIRGIYVQEINATVSS